MFTCGLLRSNFSLLIASPAFILKFEIQKTLVTRSLDLSDDLLSDVPGCLVISLEVHARRRTSLCRGAKVGRVTKHLGQRHECRHDRNITRTRFHLIDLPAPTVEVAVDR